VRRHVVSRRCRCGCAPRRDRACVTSCRGGSRDQWPNHRRAARPPLGARRDTFADCARRFPAGNRIAVDIIPAICCRFADEVAGEARMNPFAEQPVNRVYVAIQRAFQCVHPRINCHTLKFYNEITITIGNVNHNYNYNRRTHLARAVPIPFAANGAATEWNVPFCYMTLLAIE